MDYLPIYESPNGGWVYLHPLHGKDELPHNTEAARVLADFGYQVQLLPSIPEAEKTLRELLLPDVFGVKNPDVRIDGQWIGDIKTPDKVTSVKKSTINRGIYSAAQQQVDIAIINLLDREYSVQDIKKGIVGALQPNRNKTILAVWVITKNRNLFKVERGMVFNDQIYDVLSHL